jgi:CelD/BcsL family acetyltransferase involved in cellulose biosynthesis
VGRLKDTADGELDLQQYVIRVLRTEACIKELAAQWTALYGIVKPKNPFLSYEWSISYWQHLCPRSTPYLLTAWSRGVLVGLLPLRLEVRLGFRLLRFLGDGRSDYLGFLVAPNHELVFRLLTESLYKHIHEWDCVFLRRLDATYTGPDPIPPKNRFHAIQVKPGFAPYLSFQGDWTELCARGPSQLRQAQRKLKKFLLAGGIVERVSLHDSKHLAEQIKHIESNSWKKGTDTVRFQTQAEQLVLAELLSNFGPRNEIEVWLAKMHSEPVAFLINFLTPERTCYYQTAYDIKYQLYSPGTVLCFRALERTWQLGLREFDFMYGQEPFKKRWTNNQRELKKLIVFPKSLRGYLAFLALLLIRGYQKYIPVKEGYSEQ